MTKVVSIAMMALPIVAGIMFGIVSYLQKDPQHTLKTLAEDVGWYMLALFIAMAFVGCFLMGAFVYCMGWPW